LTVQISARAGVVLTEETRLILEEEPSRVSSGDRGSGLGSRATGISGGVPPNSGQSDWKLHQSQSFERLGRQSPVSVARLTAVQSACRLRSKTTSSTLVRRVVDGDEIAEVDQPEGGRDDAAVRQSSSA
jgi:hypothetical protein